MPSEPFPDHGQDGEEPEGSGPLPAEGDGSDAPADAVELDGQGFDRLETERLIMRRWQESDRAPFADLNADPETMRFFPNTLVPRSNSLLVRGYTELQPYGSLTRNR